ncbi:SsgA family sporulation/cell division regulator [Streptomyces sp. NPDC001093]|uniref:SsgA family sporulation/cell division regulator n=1 Tax=Streptomyces sp. NPDC001093 TaxID=3154376 RepID=UPI003326F601
MTQHHAGATDEGPIVCTTTILVTVAGDPPVPLPAELRYTAADPYAVRLSLGTPSAASVDWFFARSLLARGLRRPTGSGDVTVIPRHRCHPDTVRVLLSTRHGSAALEISCSAVTAFLHHTDALVPPGTEHRHTDLERIVEQLTAGSE